LDNNNIEESDIIRTAEKIMAFAGGIGIGLMYKKYEKDIAKLMKKSSKKITDK